MSGRRIWIGIAVIATAVVAAVAWMLVNGSEKATAGPVTVEVPSGWSVQENGDRGLVVARDKADLLRGTSRGPRLTARPANAELPDLAALVDDADAAGSGDETGDVTLDGHPAVEVVSGDTRVITIAMGAGRSWSIVLSGAGDELDEMLASIELDAGAAKRLDPEAVPEPPASPTPSTAATRKSRKRKRATRVLPDGDAGPGTADDLDSRPGAPNPATAATDYAVERYGMRPSEPVLGEYRSDTNPDWTLVTFDMGGRQIAVWTREIGPVWKAVTSSEGGAEAPKGFGVPKDLYPYFG